MRYLKTVVDGETIGFERRELIDSTSQFICDLGEAHIINNEVLFAPANDIVITLTEMNEIMESLQEIQNTMTDN